MTEVDAPADGDSGPRLVPKRLPADRDELLRMLRAGEHVSFREFMDAVGDGQLHDDEIEEFWPGWHDNNERMKKIVGNLGEVGTAGIQTAIGNLLPALNSVSAAAISRLTEDLRGIGADRSLLSSLKVGMPDLPPAMVTMPPLRNYQLEALYEVDRRLAQLVAIEDRSLERIANLELLTSEALASDHSEGSATRRWNTWFLVVAILGVLVGIGGILVALVK